MKQATDYPGDAMAKKRTSKGSRKSPKSRKPAAAKKRPKKKAAKPVRKIATKAKRKPRAAKRVVARRSAKPVAALADNVEVATTDVMVTEAVQIVTPSESESNPADSPADGSII
jgi:hypothetical protein